MPEKVSQYTSQSMSLWPCGSIMNDNFGKRASELSECEVETTRSQVRPLKELLGSRFGDYACDTVEEHPGWSTKDQNIP